MGANFEHAKLDGLVARRKVKFNGARFYRAGLSGVDVANTILVDAKFIAATAQGIRLRKVDASNADFSDANLSQMDARDTNFEQAEFSNANLQRANFTGCNVTAANFAGADLTGAKISQQQIDSSIGDEKTKLPDGLKRPTHWVPVATEAQEETGAGLAPDLPSPSAIALPGAAPDRD
jgi:uncharacterized protein YjbI with pentapeptide repeats